MKKTLFILLFLNLIISKNIFAYSQQEFNSVTTQQEQQVSQIREEEIEQIKIVINRRIQENKKPDLLLRLAELYIEKYRFYFLKENEVYQKRLKSGAKPSRVDHTMSHSQLKLANQTLSEILKSKIAYSKLDEVYYFLGYNFQESGQSKEAVKYFETVVSRYPNSSYAAESYRNLAEYAYDKKDYKNALKYYQQAARFTKLNSYPRTLYKLAWSNFRMRNRQEALEQMKKVVELSSKDDKFINLKDEALNDLVFFYSDAGKYSEAKTYFSSVPGGREVYVRALSRLAKTYENEGKYKQAIQLNESLLNDSNDVKSEIPFQILANNVELYKKSGNWKGEQEAISKLVKFYVEHKDELLKNSNENEDSKINIAKTKSYVRARATEFHKAAQAKKDQSLYLRAADLYTLYINSFLSDPDNNKEKKELAEIRIYKTDCLLAAKNEDAALKDLEITLTDEYADLKFRKEAGTTLLNYYIRKIDESIKNQNKEIDSIREIFLRLSDKYEQAFPKDNLNSEIRYKKARLEASRSGPDGLSSEARNNLNELIEKYPSRPEALSAAQDLINDAIKQKNSSYAVELAQQFLQNKVLLANDKKSEYTSYFKSIVNRQSFQSIQTLEKDEEYLKAAQEFEKLSSTNLHDSDFTYKALNNSAVNYEKAGRIEDSIRVYEKMLKQFPQKQDPKDDLKRLAIFKFATSQFDQAAIAFAQLSAISAFTLQEKIAFLRTSILLHMGLQDYKSALEKSERMVMQICQMLPKQKNNKNINKDSSLDSCLDVFFDSIHLFRRLDKPQDALRQLKNFQSKAISTMAQAQLNYELADLYESMHETKKAAQYYVLSSKSKTEPNSRERNYAAHSAYKLVEPIKNQFLEIKLELPESKLNANTKKKLELAEKLVQSYQNVVSYGDGEWGIAALNQLSLLFMKFALEVEHAPAPPKISGDQKLLQQYLSQLQIVSKKLKTRAFEFMNQGYLKANQLKLISNEFRNMKYSMAELNPKQFPPVDLGKIDLRTSIVGLKKQDDIESLRSLKNEWRKSISDRFLKNIKYAPFWLELGNIEVLSNRIELAKLAYEQAIQINPKYADAYSNLGLVELAKQNYKEGFAFINQASELSELNRDIRLNLAKVLSYYHLFNSSNEVLTPLLKRFEGDQEIQKLYAITSLGLGKLDYAKKYFDKNNSLNEPDYSNWYNAAVYFIIFGSKSDSENAIETCKNIIKSLDRDSEERVKSLLQYSGNMTEGDKNEND